MNRLGFTMRCIGIDWGSSSRRAYALDENGQLLAERHDQAGVLHAALNGARGGTLGQRRDFGAELTGFVGDWLRQGPRTVWLSGMIGSRLGWREAPYLPVPLALDQLGAQALDLDWPAARMVCAEPPRLRLLPGLSQLPQAGLADVMRGEETQLLGAWRHWQASGRAAADEALFILPGTHSKWAHLRGDQGQAQVLNFQTFMTGELFRLLSQQGALGSLIDSTLPLLEHPLAQQGFDEGVDWAQSPEHGLLASLFRVRAEALLAPPAQRPGGTVEEIRLQAAARLSGLLIGSELGQLLRQPALRALPLLAVGEARLCAWYARAAERLGLALQCLDPREAHLAALRALEGLGD